jgi:hypothetical protein
VWWASTRASLGNIGADLTAVWCCSAPFELALGDEAVQDGGSGARRSCSIGGGDLLVSRGDAGGVASVAYMVGGGGHNCATRCTTASVVVLSAARASVHRWVLAVLVAMGMRR